MPTTESRTAGRESGAGDVDSCGTGTSFTSLQKHNIEHKLSRYRENYVNPINREKSLKLPCRV